MTLASDVSEGAEGSLDTELATALTPFQRAKLANEAFFRNPEFTECRSYLRDHLPELNLTCEVQPIREHVPIEVELRSPAEPSIFDKQVSVYTDGRAPCEYGAPLYAISRGHYDEYRGHQVALLSNATFVCVVETWTGFDGSAYFDIKELFLSPVAALLKLADAYRWHEQKYGATRFPIEKSPCYSTLVMEA